jgi:pyruvate dehydrogenase E1 component alpha subunit
MNMNPIDLYKKMKYIRVVENTIAREYPLQEMRCPIHLSVGQEAIAVGVCEKLEANDKVFSNHRCHAHYLARGGDLYRMFAELYGKSDGCCGGRGGSMHLFDDSVGLKASIPIVGSGIPLAVGAALADKLSDEKTRAVSVVFFGDGAIEEGAFYECANFASLMSLPVLFVCENNMFSCYTHISERQPVRDLRSLAQAHSIETFHSNGNEIFGVVEASNLAVNYVRKIGKPAFLLFDTYRHLEHCGISSDDH